MYNITFKTPLFEKNEKFTDVIPHILEHICHRNFSMNPQNYFANIIDGEASLYTGYTGFEVAEGDDRTNVIEYITSPINKEIFEIERKALSEEIQKTHKEFGSVLENRITKGLYGDNYNLLSKKKPKFQDCIDYHQTYYKKENMLITGKDHEIISVGKNVTIAYSKVFNVFQSDIQSSIIKRMAGNIIYISIPYNSRQSYQLGYFIYDLMKNYVKYNQRYVEGIYYYDDIEWKRTIKHINICYPVNTNVFFDEEFFNQYKEYYIKNFSRYGMYRKIIDTMNNFGYIETQDALGLIKGFTFKNIVDYIKKGLQKNGQ